MEVGDICNYREGILVVVGVTNDSRNDITGLPLLNKSGVRVNTLVGRKYTSKYLSVIDAPGSKLYNLAKVRFMAYKNKL